MGILAVIDNRLKRLERGVRDIPPFQAPPTDDDYRVLPVQSPAATSTSLAAKLTQVQISWISVEDPNVAKYEVWISRIANGANAPYLAASVTDSPASFNVVSDGAGYSLAYIRTVMKNGIITPLTASPSVVFEVF